MKIVLALGVLVLGLVLACGATLAALRYLYIAGGCFMWDPPDWREPAGCRTRALAAEAIVIVSFLAALAAPVALLIKKKP